MTGVSDQRALWLATHVAPHEPALRAWLAGRIIVGLEIDDIVQETYTRLILLQSVDGVRNPKTYAFQTAYSVMMTHLRRSRVVSFKAMSDIDYLGAAADDPSPEQQTADRDELRHLADAISQLPPRVAEVFRLRRLQGLSQKEIAAQLGISESTVEKHMGKGIHMLAATFGRGGKSLPHASKKKIEEIRAGDVRRGSTGN
jgi:RNA polymerase sigma-70 factor (ECF subfamily)